jgi:hypothetical protein
MAVIPLSKEESRLISELMEDCDLAIPVDCADPRVQFSVAGWFVCPKGSLTKPHDLTTPS